MILINILEVKRPINVIASEEGTVTGINMVFASLFYVNRIV
jgi:hypothetical protein